ncbi:MAG: hypothetical protein AABZ02_13960, partial [Bacteroidota bacterium]
KDPSFLLLVRRFLKAGYQEDGKLVATEAGVPQGGNLSPMLSNIFLHLLRFTLIETERFRLCEPFGGQGSLLH